MPDFEIPDHYEATFTSNVELVLQQTDSRFGDKVSTGPQKGEQAQVIKRFGETSFQEKTARLQPTTFAEVQHLQRWVVPRDFDNALPVEEEDEIRMLDSPTSSYVSAMAAAWNRKKDEIIVEAALGTAKTGKNGGTNTAFDTTNFSVAVDFTLTGSPITSGMTLAKLSELKRIADAAEWPDGDRWLAWTGTQIQDVVNDPMATSNEYVTAKAIESGQPGMLHGWNFVRYNDLPVASSVRSCIAWHKSGLHLGIWKDLTTKIGERPDLKYITQVFCKGTIGATRTDEERVMRCLCSEA